MDISILHRVMDNILTPLECLDIIRAAQLGASAGAGERESSLNARTGHIDEASFEAVSLSPGSPAFDVVHQATQRAVSNWITHLEGLRFFNTKLLSASIRYSHDYRVLRYSEGASIHPHTDWDPFTVASCTIFLNEDYSGGDVVFFNGRYSYRPTQGSCMIWPADCYWVHEVKPLAVGTRWVVNCFLTVHPEELKQKVEDLVSSEGSRSVRSPYFHFQRNMT